ncbi:MAG: leucine-rich repeat domain-containing protein [Clostridia bacterium]
MIIQDDVLKKVDNDDIVDGMFNVPDYISTIDDECFSDCTSLSQIFISESVTKIKWHVFANCSNLKEITIPSSVEELGWRVFENCTSLKSAVLSEKLNTVSNYLFNNCTSLRNVVLPKNILAISANAFSGCTALKNLDLPENVKSIGKSAFYNCTSLENITLPNTITDIEDSAFEKCESIKLFSIPPLVKKLGYDIFSGCSSLLAVVLPESLKEIKGQIFKNCDSLHKIYLPKITIEFFDFLVGTNVVVKVKNDEVLVIDNFKSSKIVCGTQYIFNDKQIYIINNGAVSIYKIKDFFSKVKNANVLIENNAMDSYCHWNETIDKLGKNDFTLDANLIMALSKTEMIEQYIKYSDNKIWKRVLKDSGTEEDKLWLRDFLNLAFILGSFDENSVLRQKANQFIEDEMIRGKKENRIRGVDISDFFNGLSFNGVFNKSFVNFFMKNYDEIMVIEKTQNKFAKKVYENFEQIQLFCTSNKGSQRFLIPTIAKCVSFFTEGKFGDVEEKYKDLSKLIGNYFENKNSLNDSINIIEEQNKLKTPKNIFEKLDNKMAKLEQNMCETTESLIDFADSTIKFEWLDKYSYLNLVLGKLCNCCAHVEGFGNGITKASMIESSVQNMVFRNDKDRIIAKSTIYINRKERYGVFNNVEISDNVNNDKKEVIYQAFMRGTKTFIEKYNKNNPDSTLLQVNVGMLFNDLEDELEKHNHLDAKEPLNNFEYNKLAFNGQSNIEDNIQKIIYTRGEKEI